MTVSSKHINSTKNKFLALSQVRGAICFKFHKIFDHDLISQEHVENLETTI